MGAAWRFAVLLLSASFATFPAGAHPVDAFEICAVIDNDEARLQCFDEAVARLGAAEETEAEGTADAKESSEESAEPAERPSHAFLVEEVENKEDLAHCESLGTVEGKSGWGGRAVQKARKGIVKSAKKKAWEIGATHILVGRLEISTSMKFSTAEVEAYACPE